jgi:hypothetical protein
MSDPQRRWSFLFIVFGASLLVLALLSVVHVFPAQAQGGDGDDEPPIITDPTGDNSYCAICHSQQGRVMTLQDGSVLDLYVSPVMIADSVHGATDEHAGLGCVDCHGETVFPHSGPSPESSRDYRIRASQVCSSCHNELLADSAHLEEIAAGNLAAATCVDCHGAHNVPATENQPTLVAEVCSTCHTDVYQEWDHSPHGDMSSLGCAVCHLPHGQQLRIEDTNTLCLNCHSVPGEIYVHNIHLESDYGVTCASCHMDYDPRVNLVSDTGNTTVDHTMVVDTHACNQCHEELDRTGVWAELVGTDQQVVIERDSLRQQVATLESKESEDKKVNFVQLIQGLVFGLGIGIVILLILLPRLTRGNGNNEDSNGSEE